jgi:DNA-binding CsgD family transcriptional regulator
VAGLCSAARSLTRLLLVGALVGVLTTAAVATWIEARLTDVLLAKVVARAKDQVQLGIVATLRPSDFEPPHSAEEQADLAARLDPLLARARQADSGIIRLNLLARDGTILYSDMASLDGQVVSPLADPLLARALAGTPSVQIRSLERPENADLRARYGRALKAYLPFTVDGQVVGVYEVYQDLAPIAPIRPLVWSSVGTGTAIVVVSLVLLVARSVPASDLPEQRAEPGSRTLLSRRELEVLRLMGDGLSYSQIADRLVVHEETVRSHARAVRRKLGQPSREAAVLAARRTGLL